MQIVLEDVCVTATDRHDGHLLNPGVTLEVVQEHSVSGHEVWGDVVVRTTGRLRVNNGARLEAESIVLEGESTLEVLGGSVHVINRTYRPWVGIRGECRSLTISQGSIVRIDAPDGTLSLATSTGADAVIDVLSSRTLRIEGSTINLTAGNGLSAPEPMTRGDLDGEEFAGGNP